jgi:hypothetical protein
VRPTRSATKAGKHRRLSRSLRTTPRLTVKSQ